MRLSWLARLTLPFSPLGLRLLVLGLSAGWLGAVSGSVYLLAYIAGRIGAPAPAAGWLAVGAVVLIAAAGYAALVRAQRWLGMLLLSACGLGAGLLYWAFGAAFWLWVIDGD